MNARLLTLGLFVVYTAHHLCAAPTAYGQTPATGKADPRIGKLLDKIGWKYAITDGGTYRLIFQYDDGRTQLVLISSATEDLNGLEVRKVWSVGLEAGENPSAELAVDLLHMNERMPIGAWSLVKFPNGDRAVFMVTVGADVDEDTLGTAADFAGRTADAKEKEVHGTDEL